MDLTIERDHEDGGDPRQTYLPTCSQISSGSSQFRLAAATGNSYAIIEHVYTSTSESGIGKIMFKIQIITKLRRKGIARSQAADKREVSDPDRSQTGRPQIQKFRGPRPINSGDLRVCGGVGGPRRTYLPTYLAKLTSLTDSTPHRSMHNSMS